ncbi:MAG: Planctomycete cytochrome [Myxococcales bacterium]|nr:Planctomycete cytochrome [Myxococcales bacterium]
MRFLGVVCLLGVVGVGCNRSDGFDGCTTFVAPAADADANHDAIQTAFSDSQPGDVICFRGGRYALKDEVTLSTPNVELRGSGATRAVLDFAGQLRGANGVFVDADGFLMQHVDIKNSAGQGIRIQKSTGVTLRDVHVTWDVGPSADNGGYGIYPTESEEIVIDNCQVSYASDAGIYVGQSKHIIVKGSEVWGNVIGIEIENSADAEVYENDAHDNVGGILAFSLPFLPRKSCQRVDVHDNKVHANNQKTFAAPGSIVSQVPSGTGVMIVAADDVVVHHNDIDQNESIGVGLFSYLVTQQDDYKKDTSYNPFPHRAWIHDNRLSTNGTDPHDQASTITGLVGVQEAEQLLWDGMIDSADGAANNGNCFSTNGGASYRNLDFEGAFNHSTTDIAPVTCTRAPLVTEGPYPTVALAARTPRQPHDKLSEYGFFAGALAAQTPADGVIAYDVAASLFADQSKKLRFMALPPGGKIGFDATGNWTFPDGTAFLKSFYFDEAGGARTLAETRIEMKLDGVWTLQTYLWDAAQAEATRFVAGRTLHRGDGDYRVPSSDQCKTCHFENDTPVPLGPRTRQLNRDVVSQEGWTVNQLDDWAMRGLFASAPPAAATLQKLVDPFGNDALESRARSYLDANCAHCHSMGGTASATNLRLDFATTDWAQLGVCKSPVSAGPGSGQLLFDVVPGDPDHSIVVHRMRSVDPAVKMPQLPTMTSDAAGTGLIAAWIQSLQLPGCMLQ